MFGVIQVLALQKKILSCVIDFIGTDNSVDPGEGPTWFVSVFTVKPVLRGHLKIDKTKVLRGMVA